MTSTPEPVDERLLVTEGLARAALAEITGADSVGDAVGYLPEADGVVSLRFENRMPGYPGWFWTVSVARVDDAEPTVLEVELMPGDDALLAPDWVPWAVRLAEYQAAQAAVAETVEAGEADDLDTDDDDLDDDEDDDIDDEDEDDELHADGSSILHAGDVDGVDIDELADDEGDESDDDEDEDDDLED